MGILVNDTQIALNGGLIYDSSFPSNQYYYDITDIQQSGDTYTVPDNGWILISGETTRAGGWCSIENRSNGAMGAFSAGYGSAGNAVNCNIPVLKGTEIAIAWDGITINKKVFIKTAQEIIEPTNTDIDYVVSTQLPTAENGYTWYRLYKSGWVEQGGKGISASRGTITFPIEMYDGNYCLTFGGSGNTGSYNTFLIGGFSRETTGFTIQSLVVNNISQTSGTNSSTSTWQVSGMSKQ